MIRDFKRATDKELRQERESLARSIQSSESYVDVLKAQLKTLNDKIDTAKTSLAKKRRKMGFLRQEIRLRTPHSPSRMKNNRESILGEALSQLCQDVAKQRGVMASEVADEVLSRAREVLKIPEE